MNFLSIYKILIFVFFIGPFINIFSFINADDDNNDETASNWNNHDDVKRILKYPFNIVTSKQNRQHNGYRSPSASIKTTDNDDNNNDISVIHENDDDEINDQNRIEQELTNQQLNSNSIDDDHHNNNNNIRIAVQSKRHFEFVPVHYDREDPKIPRMIEIVSDTMPLRLHFKSQSAAIVVTQSHMSPPMKPVDETVTMDEPFRLSHKAYKPIVQEVKEIIQPYRNIVQQVKPVIEDIRTIVPQDNDINHRHQIGSKWNHRFPVNVNREPKINRKFVQSNRFYNKYKNHLQQHSEQVKTSETQQHKIERNVHPYFNIQYARLNNNNDGDINHSNRRDKRNRPIFSNQMQLESSEPEMIYAPRIVSNPERIDQLTRNNMEENHIIRDLYKDINKNNFKIEKISNDDEFDHNYEPIWHHSSTTSMVDSNNDDGDDIDVDDTHKVVHYISDDILDHYHPEHYHPHLHNHEASSFYNIGSMTI